jgi:mono/diheme cytochrome c family protein
MTRILAFCFVILFAGCAGPAAPNVTPEMAAVTSGRPITMAQLQHGRVLFASRCIECHALPAVTSHSASEWPRLIGEMAGRANLKPADQQAVLAYVLAAARVQSTD